MSVYRDAVRATTGKSYESALARLDALLLVDPATVAIDLSSVPAEGRGLANSLDPALDIWRGAIVDSPFRAASAGEKPQIVVKFVRSMSDIADAQGDVQAQRDFFWSKSKHGYKLSATVRVVYRTGSRLITRDEAAGIIAHELGHLLGLDDYPSGTGLMGFFIPGSPKKGLEPEELNALLEFRQMVKDQVDLIRRAMS